MAPSEEWPLALRASRALPWKARGDFREMKLQSWEREMSTFCFACNSTASENPLSQEAWCVAEMSKQHLATAFCLSTGCAQALTH